MYKNTVQQVGLKYHISSTFVQSAFVVAQWSRCCATNRKVVGSIQPVSLEFYIDIKSFRSHYGPGVDSAFNINAFPGGKGGRCIRLTTLPPSCAVVTKSGNLNFLGPSGPLQACNGTVLPLPFTLCVDDGLISG